MYLNHAAYLTYDDWEYEDYEKYFGKLPNGSNKRDAWVQLPNGVSPSENPDDPILISLTTYPKRTEPGTPWRVWVTIESLMRQTKKPQKIVLFLAKDEYPNREDDLPQTLRDLKKRGLEIFWVNENLKAGKKLIPALENFTKYTVITADDDIVYTKDLIEKLYNHHLKHPKKIIANRARPILIDSNSKRIEPYENWSTIKTESIGSFLMTGVNGVLYPKNGDGLQGLHPIVLDKRYNMIYETNDDHWFWLCALLQGTKVYTSGGVTKSFISWPYDDPLESLSALNLNGRNDQAMRKILMLFPEIRKNLGVDETSYKLHPRLTKHRKLNHLIASIKKKINKLF